MSRSVGRSPPLAKKSRKLPPNSGKAISPALRQRCGCAAFSCRQRRISLQRRSCCLTSSSSSRIGSRSRSSSSRGCQKAASVIVSVGLMLLLLLLMFSSFRFSVIYFCALFHEILWLVATPTRMLRKAMTMTATTTTTTTRKMFHPSFPFPHTHT